MAILSGWLKTRAYRKTANGYKKETRDTSSETVFMNDGNTAETNLGAIKGITDSLTATSSNVALSASGGNNLQGQINTLNSSLDGKLSLDGGEMLAPIRHNGDFAQNSADNGSLNIYGGTGYEKGAALILRGKDQNRVNGLFELRANDGTKESSLVGFPDGTLYYAGKVVALNNQYEFLTNYKNGSSNNNGLALLLSDNEGGNLRLQRNTSDGINPHIELDTFAMNGSTGYARFYLGTAQSELNKVFCFGENGDFLNANGVSLDAVHSTANAADIKSNDAINAINALAGAVSNLQIYFEDTVASSLLDCFNQKCLSARIRFTGNKGVFCCYGGWRGKDYGLFIGQVVNNNVIGLYIQSSAAYKVWLSDGTDSCSYVEISHGGIIS